MHVHVHEHVHMHVHMSMSMCNEPMIRNMPMYMYMHTLQWTSEQWGMRPWR